MSEKKLGDGEPSPPPDSKIRQALMTHWLSQIECNHYEKSDSAICACGWKSERGCNVGKAVELWIDHVFLESGAAQEVSPPSPRPKMMWGWDIEEIKSAMRQFQSKHPGKLPSEIEQAERIRGNV